MDSDMVAMFIRTLLSEGQVVYQTVGKDEHGNLVARKVVKEGPTGLFTTTTAAALHPENETRMSSLFVKDTQDQTGAVFKEIAKHASGDAPVVDYEPWHAHQLWLGLGPRRVVIPYAPALAEEAQPIAVRLRRDFSTVVALIQAHALLHRGTRELDGHGRIIATFDDYEVVHALVSDLIAEGVGKNVDDTVRQTVDAVAALIAPRGENGTASTLEIATALKLDRSAATRRIKRGQRDGYLRNLETRKGQPAKICPGNPLPENIPILPSREDLEKRQGLNPPENASTPGPGAKNPEVTSHIAVQTTLHSDAQLGRRCAQRGA